MRRKEGRGRAKEGRAKEKNGRRRMGEGEEWEKEGRRDDGWDVMMNGNTRHDLRLLPRHLVPARASRAARGRTRAQARWSRSTGGRAGATPMPIHQTVPLARVPHRSLYTPPQPARNVSLPLSGAKEATRDRRGAGEDDVRWNTRPSVRWYYARRRTPSDDAKCMRERERAGHASMRQARPKANMARTRFGV